MRLFAAFPVSPFLFLWILCLLSNGMSFANAIQTNGTNIRPYHAAFSLVEPDTTHTHLKLSKEGILAISRIKTPIAIVSVIGPYRSGKSFLLNQLLSLSCSEGFGVGHQRETKTKGIWVWGEPFEVSYDGKNVSVFFFDTEGFESIGKSTVYDDRIFALATIVSSVLIYNLAETVKEADIKKLSFAVELANEFFGRVKGRENSFEPAHLLWLIQRDFLKGLTVQEMVDAALRPVPNSNNDPDIEELNKVRKSLKQFSENGTAFGLAQPHLERTQLCEFKDKDLNPKYIKQREQLKHKLRTMILPKRMGTSFLNGEEFASLIEQTLEALNVGVIPSAGSVIETFNLNVIKRCVENYKRMFSDLNFPVPELELEQKHSFALSLAKRTYESERFGIQDEEQALIPLQVEISKAYELYKQKNELASSKKCERFYARCEDELESLQNMLIPSTTKFDQDYKSCLKNTEKFCDGPSKEFYIERLGKMWNREREQFLQSYNHRLFNLLVTTSFLSALVFRFILKVSLLEVLCWALFLFLETYTRLFWSIHGLYSNPVWVAFISLWEIVVYNPLVDLNKCIFLVFGFLLLCLVYRAFRVCKKWVSPKRLPILNKETHKN